MRTLIIAICLLITACDQQQQPNLNSPANESTQTPQQTQSGGGMLEHMAGAAVAGAAAGSAGAVAHNMTNRAMKNWDKRRRAKPISTIRARRR
jgi:hypothetical protein